MKNKAYSTIGHLLVIFACTTFAACATVEQTPEDKKLERTVERAIASSPALSSTGVLVSVQNGVVILKGTTQKGIDKTIIEKTARNVEGVIEVRNYIFAD